MTSQHTGVSGSEGITTISLAWFQGSKAGIEWQKKEFACLYLTGEKHLTAAAAKHQALLWMNYKTVHVSSDKNVTKTK